MKTYSEDEVKEMNEGIIIGDCLDAMKMMKSESFDLIITSPPYNLGNNHHTGNIRHKAYDDNMPEPEYQDNQIAVLNECYRILKPEGSMFYNHKNRIKEGFSITPYGWLLKTHFVIKQEIVWFNRSQNFDKCRFYPMTERIYWLAKSPQTKLYNAINHHDLFTKQEWQAEGTSKEHTRAFPEKMVADILACFPEAQSVLDPYGGSGTVAVVCKKMGRNDFVIIEKEEKYAELASKRLKNTQVPFL